MHVRSNPDAPPTPAPRGTPRCSQLTSPSRMVGPSLEEKLRAVARRTSIPQVPPVLPAPGAGAWSRVALPHGVATWNCRTALPHGLSELGRRLLPHAAGMAAALAKQLHAAAWPSSSARAAAVAVPAVDERTAIPFLCSPGGVFECVRARVRAWKSREAQQPCVCCGRQGRGSRLLEGEGFGEMGFVD